MDLEPLHSAEIAVRAPKFLDAMCQAKGSNARIMKNRASQFTRQGDFFQAIQMSWTFRKHSQSRSLEERLQKGECLGYRTGGAVNPGMGYDGQKFMQNRPGQGPGRRALGQAGYGFLGLLMKWRILPVGINEDLGIQGYQTP